MISYDSDEEEYSENEEYDGIMKKALDVQLPPNFQPSATPRSGEEYLRNVIYERSKCKDWVTVKLDESKLKSPTVNITKNAPTVDSTTKNPSKVVPLEWRQQKLDEFLELQHFLQTKILLTNELISHIKEEDFVEFLTAKSPKFSEMLQYSQCAKMQMIEIIGRNLDKLSDTPEAMQRTGTWIYAIFLLLEKPLSPNYCHSLRQFSKKCKELRNRRQSDDKEFEKQIGLFIHIVATYFNQLDLID